MAVSDAELDRLLLLPRPPKIFAIFIKLLSNYYSVVLLLLFDNNRTMLASSICLIVII